MVTSRPRATSETAAVSPVGPAPTTSTSVVVGSMRKPPRVKDSGRSARIEATGSTGFDLADLDEVAVGIAHVAADLDAVVLWLGEELGAPGPPHVIAGGHVGHPNVHEAGDFIQLPRRPQPDRRLVIGRSATNVEDQPGVPNPHDRWVSGADHGAAENPRIELRRSVDVRHGQVERDDKPILGPRSVSRRVTHIQLPSASAVGFAGVTVACEIVL